MTSKRDLYVQIAPIIDTYCVYHYRIFLFQLTLFLVLTRAKSRAKLPIAQIASVEKGIFGGETRDISRVLQAGNEILKEAKNLEK